MPLRNARGFLGIEHLKYSCLYRLMCIRVSIECVRVELVVLFVLHITLDILLTLA